MFKIGLKTNVKMPLKQENTQNDNYVFVGPAGCGKTTFFTIMAYDYRERANNSGGKLIFRCKNKTDRFLTACINQLKKGDWPAKTQISDEPLNTYDFTIIKQGKLLKKSATLAYHDYPGEIYSAAFEEELQQPLSQTQKDAVESLKNAIKIAHGIFLLVDAEALYIDDNLANTTITNFFEYLQGSKCSAKLAIVFNKLELFGETINEQVAEEMLKKKFPGAYAWLLTVKRKKIFTVKTLGTIKTGESGELLPPSTRISQGVLEVADWMLGF